MIVEGFQIKEFDEGNHSIILVSDGIGIILDEPA